MEIGLYDVPDRVQLESLPVAADGYGEHIRGAQEPVPYPEWPTFFNPLPQSGYA